MQEGSMQKHPTHLLPKVWSVSLPWQNKNSFLKFHKEKPVHLNVMLIMCLAHIRTRKHHAILLRKPECKETSFVLSFFLLCFFCFDEVFCVHEGWFCQRRLFASEVLKRQLLQLCNVSKKGGDAHGNFCPSYNRFKSPSGPIWRKKKNFLHAKFWICTYRVKVWCYR